MTIDLDTQFHHARRGAAIHHHVVHCQGVENALAIAKHLTLDQRTPVFFERAMQHGRQGGFEILQRNVGDEAQTPLVDADQRRTKGGQLPTNAQHGAVAAHHQSQIARGSNTLWVQGRVAGDSAALRCLGLQRHPTPLRYEKSRDPFEHVA